MFTLLARCTGIFLVKKKKQDHFENNWLLGCRLFESTKNNILFSSLTEAHKRTLFDAMLRVDVNAGNVIINEGVDGDFFYVVLEGVFDVYKLDSGSVPVFTYNSSGSFGELALM